MAEKTRTSIEWPSSKAVEKVFSEASALAASARSASAALDARFPNMDALTDTERRVVATEMLSITGTFLEGLVEVKRNNPLSKEENEALDRFDLALARKVEKFTGEKFTTWKDFDQNTDYAVLKDALTGNYFTAEERRYMLVQVSWVEAQITAAMCNDMLGNATSPAGLKRQ